MRVLVVDDDAAVRDSLARTMRFEGYQIDTAADGQLAIEAVRDAEPDAMILDVSMPRLDGWELCEILRRQSQTREVPVLFITGRTDVRDRITAMQVGGTDFISKPFHAKDLRAKVRALVGRDTGGAIGRR